MELKEAVSNAHRIAEDIHKVFGCDMQTLSRRQMDPDI